MTPFSSTIAFNDFDLPIVLDRDSDYLNELRRILNSYLKQVQQISNLPNSVKCSTSRNISLILDCVEDYFNYDIATASNKISSILNKYKNSPFFISQVCSNYAFKGISKHTGMPNFYRARKGNFEFQINDLLHIPLNKRGIISTQRFSIPGIPCIYLGTTSYVCWLELDKPLDNELNISSFNIPNIKVLNLALTQHLINGHSNVLDTEDPSSPEVKKLFHMIELWPLVCATSFRIKEANRIFKSEYIVSNLIMQNIVKLDVDGVAYISKKVKNDSMSFPQAVNLAIPIKKPVSNQAYGELCRKIKITDPVNFGEFIKIKHRLMNNLTSLVNQFEGFSTRIDFAGEQIDYHTLDFSKLDDYLLSKDFKTPTF
ncbi:hypothetical protein [Caryophanon latum]|uniref:RES domain-containing protein n=1 Tax=Caryophanon latum TaxID=33977 RepID=A0A1C0YWV1_9BACL|nr:hypothetical protein [Caryophanon latum]OCS91658.1 hypothetical protein A6K76_08415 [Caryophanon latum]